MWATGVFRHGANSPAINVFRKENKETAELNAALQDNKAAFRKGEKQQNLDGLISSRRPFTWENLS